MASTNLQIIIYILNSLTNKTDPGKVSKGDARKNTNELFDDKQSKVGPLLYRLKTYTQFMVVRHPLERFVGAYRDQTPNPFFRPQRKAGKEPNFLRYIDYCISKVEKASVYAV